VQAARRLTIEVLDVAGEPVPVEVTVRLDTVEVWSHERCRAAFERSRLAAWFHAPVDTISCDDVSFGFQDRRYYILVDPVAPWRLLPRVTVRWLLSVLI
jgi:hypothetical protein